MTPILICVSLLMLLCVWIVWDIGKSDYESNVAADKLAAEKRREEESARPQFEFKAVEAPVAPPAGIVPASTGQVFECRRAPSGIQVDGNIDTPAWAGAATIGNFLQMNTTAPARSRTEAKLLWDDQYLYFSAQMDDTDVYATIKEHNGMLWNNDVFELFFKPDSNKLGYYEFEVSPLNTTLEMYLPSRGSGGYGRWVGKHKFNLESKVQLRPGTTLNNPSDRDGGWIVQGRIPWTDFAPTGGKPAVGAEWKFTLARFDFSVNLEMPEPSTISPVKDGFHDYEKYLTLRFVGP